MITKLIYRQDSRLSWKLPFYRYIFRTDLKTARRPKNCRKLYISVPKLIYRQISGLTWKLPFYRYHFQDWPESCQKSWKLPRDLCFYPETCPFTYIYKYIILYTNIKFVKILYIIIKYIIQIYLQWYFIMSPW